MERDWVPTLASSSLGVAFNLTHLNTILRRIDILCKFIAPLAISTFISAVAPAKEAVIVVAITSVISFVPECWCVQKVYWQSGRLQTQKNRGTDEPSHPSTQRWKIASKVWASVESHIQALRYFFNSPVWVPSLGIAILHASVLTYSATFITYLLNIGFPLGMLTVAKALGSIFEIGSTFVFAWGVNRLSETKNMRRLSSIELHNAEAHNELLKNETDEDDREAENWKDEQQSLSTSSSNTGVVRVGLWGICGLLLSLVCDTPF